MRGKSHWKRTQHRDSPLNLIACNKRSINCLFLLHALLYNFELQRKPDHLNCNMSWHYSFNALRLFHQVLNKFIRYKSLPSFSSSEFLTSYINNSKIYSIFPWKHFQICAHSARIALHRNGRHCLYSLIIQAENLWKLHIWTNVRIYKTTRSMMWEMNKDRRPCSVFARTYEQNNKHETHTRPATYQNTDSAHCIQFYKSPAWMTRLQYLQQIWKKIAMWKSLNRNRCHFNRNIFINEVDLKSTLSKFLFISFHLTWRYVERFYLK